MTDSKPHSELADQVRQEQLGDVWVALGALGRLVDETEQNDYIDNQERIVRDALLRVETQLVGLYEQLETCRKEKHVQNFEWAISLAESDPLYAEVFRPYFQKIVDALASNPAKEPEGA